MSAEKLLRPVVDPSLPPDEWEVLAESADGLRPAGEKEPKPGGRTGADAWWALGIATACGFAPAAALPAMLGGVGAVLGVLAQVGTALLWWKFGFGAFLGAGTGLQIIAWIVLFACSGDSARGKLGRQRHGRYFLTDDFGAVQDMVRTQRAVIKTQDSELHKAGMLPNVDLRVVEWEIALSLRAVTAEKRRLRKLAKANPGDDALRREMQPQWREVNAKLRRTRDRISKVDKYAARVSTAGVFYRKSQAGEESDERFRSAMAEVAEVAIELLHQDEPGADAAGTDAAGGEVGK